MRARTEPAARPPRRRGATIAVVPIREAHAASFRACVDRVARERRYFAMLEAPPLAQIATLVRENLEGQNPHFVALDGATVVGWCDIVRMLKRQVFAHRGVLGIGVLPAYRGRGLGRALLGAALERARASGFVRVELNVRADNERAIGLYRSAGFRQEGRLRDALFLDGDFHDLLQMGLVWRRGGAGPASRASAPSSHGVIASE